MEAIEDLPIGLAVHSVVEPASMQTVTFGFNFTHATPASATDENCCFPYLYVNPYYVRHCSDFSAQEVWKSPYKVEEDLDRFSVCESYLLCILFYFILFTHISWTGICAAWISRYASLVVSLC